MPKLSLLILILLMITIKIAMIINNNYYVKDFANIHIAVPHQIFEPINENEILNILKNHENMKISIAGSKYSHGGHTMKDGALYIDMKNLNRILELRNGIVTVESGITWNKLIKFLDKYNLSVAEMQSYSNFSVGGSVSVNCHGRSTIYGTISDTIEGLKVVTSNGDIIYCSRDTNYDLFRACIGGYGGIAIIIEVSLKTVNNFYIERKIINTRSESLNELLELSKSGIETNLVFFNINIYPTPKYTYKKHDLLCVLWYKTKNVPNANGKKKLSDIFSDYIEHCYVINSCIEFFLRRTNIVKLLRARYEPKELEKNIIKTRNQEMDYNAEMLEPLIKYPTTTVLQEYFIPIHNADIFNNYFWYIIEKFQVNLLNLSIRYVKKTNIPLLNYAKEDVAAFVIYYNIWNNEYSIGKSSVWGKKLIQKSIFLSGTFYLPYLHYATNEQFEKSYPDYKLYLKIKEKYDPGNRLTNQFLDRYLNNKGKYK
jgi:hypothetical protein